MIVAESKVYLSRQVKRNLAKAIDFIQYIEIGRDTSGLPPLHIIEESYLQTFSHSLFDIQKYDDSIIITTNLPDNYILLVKSNLSKNSDRKTVTNGSVMLENAQNISSITIDSAFITDSSVKKQLGTKARNLIGEYVKYNPICGNQIHAVFNF